MSATPKGLSASRGPAVVGLSEFQSQFEVWQLLMEEREPGFNARRGYTLPEDPDSPPIRWGSAFESAVIDLAEVRHGEKIGHREQFFHVNLSDGDPNIQHAAAKMNAAQITCHIDGRYRSGIIHEGKTTAAFSFREKWGEPGTDRVPQYVQVQVQHQMICTGADEDIVSVLVFPETPESWEKQGWKIIKSESMSGAPHFELQNEDGRRSTPKRWAFVLWEMGYFYQFPCHAVKEAQDILVDGYRDFWNRYVTPGVEPELSTYDDIRRAFPEPVGTIVCDEQMERWIKEYKDIGAEIGGTGPLSKRKNQLKIIILDVARKMSPAIDDESRDKTIFRDRQGKKLAQFSKSGFRN